jgi:MFS superfamily sulfate permease-like transporter
MYRRRPSAAAAMTASFSAALIGSPPVAVLAPSEAMVVLAMFSVRESTADMMVRRA